MGALSAPAARMPVFPSWDAAGRPVELTHQIDPIRIPAWEHRGTSLGNLRAFVEAIRGSVDSHCICDINLSSPTFGHRVTWQALDLYHVFDSFVKPMTALPKCSLAELIADA